MGMRPAGSAKFRGWWNVSICAVLIVFGIVVFTFDGHWMFLAVAGLGVVMEVLFVRKLLDAYR
jgi:hypothetical protein